MDMVFGQDGSKQLRRELSTNNLGILSSD